MVKAEVNSKGKQANYRGMLLKNFKCKCGRAYASYAAVYTHIKNKHQHEREKYNKLIQRPNFDSNRKGRPKKPVSGFKDQQIEQINLFEIALLHICSLIKTQKSETPKQLCQVFFERNQKLLVEEILEKYDILCLNKSVSIHFNLLDSQSDFILRKFHLFFLKFVQHLTPQYVAKFLLAINLCIQDYAGQGFHFSDLAEWLSKKQFQDKISQIWTEGKQNVRILAQTLLKYEQLHKNEVDDNEIFISSMLEIDKFENQSISTHKSLI